MSERRVVKKAPKKRRGILRRILIFLIAVGVLFVGVSIFFRVSEVVVQGAGKYASGEIIEASGIIEGDNMFLVDKAEVERNILNEFIYIKEVTVTRKYPDRIVLDVEESVVTANIIHDSTLWLLNSEMKVLESKTPDSQEYGPTISGLQFETLAVGEFVVSADSRQIEFLHELMTEFEEKNIISEIDRIDVSDMNDIRFRYQDRLEVKLGKGNDPEYQVAYLLEIVKNIDEIAEGTVDLTGDKEASFVEE